MLFRRGSRGDEVRSVQTKLGVTADGIFGPNTESALRKWQSDNGIPSTGEINQVTWDRMFPKVVEQTNSTLSQTNRLSFDISRLRGNLPDSVFSQITDTALRFNITSPLRLAHFLSQCSHESGGFTLVTENLNYSADGLLRIFPRYFNSQNVSGYARNPQKIANRVYSSRMGNGDEASGDGFRFRGRGFIQLTGRSNYAQFDNFVSDNIIENPDLVATKFPLMSAAFFFDTNKLWSVCDRGSDTDTVTAVTRRVNGGTIGLDHRLKEFNKFWRLLQ